MKKNSSLIKASLILIIVAIFSYIGLEVPHEYVEDVVDEAIVEQSNTSIPTQDPSPTDTQSYKVVSVIDGDTFKVSNDNETFTVRLIGIDTPETEYARHGAECYGAESSKEASRLLQNTYITLQTDDSQDLIDTYDRLLAYAIMDDQRDFGEVMIRNGFAKEYTFANAYQNQEKYRAAENSARSQNIGLWKCN